MPQNFRQSEILEIARLEKKVVVDDLAERLQVTAQTIRRDLADLTQSGQLARVHGGAILPSNVANIGYLERRKLNEQAKSAVAQRCAADIPDNASLFLNIGTSTEAVARALVNHNNITVVTNNLNVANILAANKNCEVIVAGGSLRRTDGGLVGGLTVQFVQQFKVDIAIIGTSAMDDDGDLLDFDLQEVGVSKAIIQQSRRVHLVTDASKLSRKAPVRIGSLKQIDTIYTDYLPDGLKEKCREWETRVVENP